MQSNFLADSQIAAGKLVDGKAKPCHDGVYFVMRTVGGYQ